MNDSEQSAALWRTQRLDQACAPQRVRDELAIALDIINGLDRGDIEHDVLLAQWHMTYALAIARDDRV